MLFVACVIIAAFGTCLGLYGLLGPLTIGDYSNNQKERTKGIIMFITGFIIMITFMIIGIIEG